MQTHAEKQSQSRSEAKKPGESAFQFNDRRPETAALNRLQALADASPQAAQARARQVTADVSPRTASAARYSAMQSAPVQRAKTDDEDVQLKTANAPQAPLQRTETAPRPNNTGLPDNLKNGVEALSGLSLNNVKVHYNSGKPAQLNAYAYAQGTDIHVGPGQEKHLPHEAWHVVQQAQGRVRPTMQMKEAAINDDVGMEAEADAMGERAVSDSFLQRRPFPSHASTSPASNDITQRKLRIGKNYEFLGEKNEIPKDIKAGRSATYVLKKMKADNIVYGFDSMEELQEFVDAVDSVEGSSDLIERALDEPMFVSEFAQADIWFHFKLGNWMIAQMHALSETVNNVDRDKEFLVFSQQISGCVSPMSTLEVLVAAFKRLIFFQTQSFVLNKSRDMNEGEGRGSIEDQRYGYHLTKVHNLKGIRATGLQPTEGASQGGSLAMSTSEQQTGSKKTSEGMIAYALHPETFRPYINQFEDRRQMMERQPIELKPVMLRFLITQAVRERGQKLPVEGVYDYMDRTAVNSDVPVLPDLIEVLTPNGFVPIRNYDHTSPDQILDLRAEGDNARMDDRWEGKMAVFNYEQLSSVSGLWNLLGFNEKSETYIEEVTRLNTLRDVKSVNIEGISYVFRGGTFQTSGNRKSWQYAFSIVGEDIPKWLVDRIGDYEKNFQVLSNLLIARLHKEYKKEEAPLVEYSALQDQFEIGESSGLDLNCLLYTIYQLANNTRTADESRVTAMRGVLVEAGYAAPEGEIDIYGGAGMQLANDLGVRLQVHQRIGSQYVEHPVLGAGGPILHILHRSRHFAPLWPK